MQNFDALIEHLGMTRLQAVKLALNSITGSFMSVQQKENYIKQIMILVQR
jgi:adenosine deaminase